MSAFLRVGIDIGGTFTDFVIYHPLRKEFSTFKVLSTPEDPAEAVLQGLERLREGGYFLAPGSPPEIVHGSTVATNALLERKGAQTALVVTSGFGDLLQIGRQNRPVLYDWFATPPSALVPPELCFELVERVDAGGNILQALDPGQVEALACRLQAAGSPSTAVCLLYAFLRPEHEQAVGARLRAAGLRVSLSSEILPEYREYERASTTVVNAYVSPVLDRYLGHLQSTLAGEAAAPGGSPALRIMQSNGGSISLEEARRFGVRCILSGPAGGLVGAQYSAGQALGDPVSVITFDMGGTSTDVSLIAGQPTITTEAVIGGCPVHIPLLDIHTIGAGGGSIARADAGGALRVGPDSAGANPGPACYGRGGDLPTVTDANLVLGRLAGEHFLGGEMPLQADRAWAALERLGRSLGLDARAAALGVIEVANAHMERALRVISVERGHDPRGGSGLPPFTLLSFGGAGGLHAAELARRLGIGTVLAPPMASTLSAFGMLAADIVKDYTQTIMLPGDTPLADIAARLEALQQRGRQDILAEGAAAEDILLEPALDMRYLGQSYELTVPFGPQVTGAFHTLHYRAYGYNRPGAPLEIVNLRLRATGKVTPPPLPALPTEGPDPSAAWLEARPVVFGRGAVPKVPFYRGEALRPGNLIAGPAVIVRADTTFLLGPGDRGRVDSFGNLIIVVG